MADHNQYSQLVGYGPGLEGDHHSKMPFTDHGGSLSDDGNLAVPDQSGSFEFNSNLFLMGSAAPAYITDIGNATATRTRAPTTSAFFNDNIYRPQVALHTPLPTNDYRIHPPTAIFGAASSNNNLRDLRIAPPPFALWNGKHDSHTSPLPSSASNNSQLGLRGATPSQTSFDFNSADNSRTHRPAEMPPNSITNAPPRLLDPIHRPAAPRPLARGTSRRHDHPFTVASQESQVVDGGPQYLREKRKRVALEDDDSNASNGPVIKVSKRRRAATKKVDSVYSTPAKKHATRSGGKAAVPADDDADESDAFAYSTTPADGARASKKARQKRSAPTNDPAEVVEWPTINTNITTTLSLADASKIATYISPLQIKGKDDWVAVKADKLNGIKALMDAFNVPLPTEPPSKATKPFPEKMKPLWLQNQTIAYNANMESITLHPHSRFLESCCTVAWYMLIEAHNTDANPNAGPRQCGTMTVNTKMKCSVRLQAMVDAIAGGALVRQDVTTGQRIPDFVANPTSFASKKTVNQRNNAGRKEKFRDLIKKRGT
nr:hypothetical protein B0A51_07606 [Rachicladosporium sp. CCFEE 5018]